MTLFHHLWQSTLFAAVAWTLTLPLKDHRARVRYWIWFAASCKFLLPFSLLVSLGSQVGTRTAGPIAPHRVSVIVERVFAPDISRPAPSTLPARTRPWPWLLGGMWACGSAAVLFGWARAWRRLDGPAVVGIWRQRLVLPGGIEQRLSAEELAAVVSHEHCHMRCRDNLTAAIHMLVEAAFWFHPLVWWMEARLVEERERACDEEVLRTGSAPEVYASGILKVCEFCLKEPLLCAAGVTGADLKRRIHDIVHWRGVRGLNTGRRALLAAVAVIVVALPIVIGADRLAFEVASVKRFQPVPTGEVQRKIDPSPDRLVAHRQNLRDLILWAYEGEHPAELEGPASLDGEDYDVSAKAGKTVTRTELRQMLQTLLIDRFHLALHRETKTQGVYALTVGPHGHKLHAVQQESTRRMGMHFDNGVAEFTMTANAERLAEVVSMFNDRKVIDETGLHGVYQITLRVPMDANPFEQMQAGAIFHGFGPTPGIFSVMDQLGLKLVSKKAPVDFLVIDHVERPTEN